MTEVTKTENSIYSRISVLLKTAKAGVIQNVNSIMTTTYFEIGRIIIEEEQEGKLKADYGRKLIVELSKKLTKEFGKGFSSTNLKQMRSFYQVYS